MSECASDVMRRWFERVWTQSDPTGIDEMFPPEALAHGIDGLEMRGPVEFRAFWDAFHASFEDIRIEVVDAVDNGNMTYVRCEAHVTFRGEPIVISGGSMCRVEDGQLMEAWDTWNFAAAMQDMGALPPNAFARACGGATFAGDDAT